MALVLTYIGILGLPEDLKRWERLAKAVDWYYWLNSGEWWPWSIRAVLLAVLFIGVPTVTEQKRTLSVVSRTP